MRRAPADVDHRLLGVDLRDNVAHLGRAGDTRVGRGYPAERRAVAVRDYGRRAGHELLHPLVDRLVSGNLNGGPIQVLLLRVAQAEAAVIAVLAERNRTLDHEDVDTLPGLGRGYSVVDRLDRRLSGTAHHVRMIANRELVEHYLRDSRIVGVQERDGAPRAVLSLYPDYRGFPAGGKLL